jgi:hypothetical protein
MEVHWSHHFYIFDFIKDDFHNCKKGLSFHACFCSSVSLAIYMLKGERKMQFLNQILVWLHWKHDFT